MVFSELIFLFGFFVLSSLAVLLTRRLTHSLRAENAVLLLSSLLFYAWGGPLLVLLLVGMTLICYFGAMLCELALDEKTQRTVFIVTIAAALGLLGFFKYTNLLTSTVCAIFGRTGGTNIVLPIGISFYTFQLISYVADVKRGQVRAQRNFAVLLLYASLFHQCIAGPIVRYSDVEQEILHRAVDEAEISRGITRFATGLCKKALLANGCAALCETLLPMDAALLPTLSSLGVALGGLCYTLQIYLDFSAYSDMAIGMGLMTGFHYRENFNFPYLCTSITDFWRRWHISLSSFFRDYVYIPLGGSRVPAPRHLFNLFAVWALTGLWHGASWNYLLWGLYFFVFLVAEKYVLDPVKEDEIDGLGRVLRRIYALGVVYFGWFLFRYEDLSLLGPTLGALFGANDASCASALTILGSNWIFLAICILCCTPALYRLHDQCAARFDSERGRTVLAAAEIAMPVILLFLSVTALVGDTYNPFLYLRF